MGAIVFFTFVAVIVVAGISANVLNTRAKIDLIRHAIEKGQPIDPALIDKIMGPRVIESPPKASRTGTGLKLGGVMALAAGVGFPIMGYFLDSIDREAFPALQGVGSLAICMGIGMLIASKIVQSTTEPSDKRP